MILRALGYTSGTQIYVASGQVYGGKNRMAPLRNMFPNLVGRLKSTSDCVKLKPVIPDKPLPCIVHRCR